MKKLIIIAMVLLPLFVGSELWAQCGGCSTNNPMTMLPDHIILAGNPGAGAGDATVRASFYANKAVGGVYLHNCDAPFYGIGTKARWLNSDATGWYIAGNWQDPAGFTYVSGCTGTTNYTTVIIAYDPNYNTATHAATAVFITQKYLGGGYPFQSITPSTITPVAIPYPTIGTVTDQGANVDVTVTWTGVTLASTRYYNTACFATETGACDPFWGYKLYYKEVTGTTGPTRSDLDAAVGERFVAALTTSGTAAEVAYGTNTATIRIPKPATGNNTWIALGLVGAGSPTGKAALNSATQFVTGFVSQNSPNYVSPTPAAIELLSFGASDEVRSALITWQTASEVGTAGFNILRADSATSSKKTKINSALIPARGQAGGASYKFDDAKVETGKTYYYWLEEVENSGNKAEYGSVGVTITGKIPHAPATVKN